MSTAASGEIVEEGEDKEGEGGECSAEEDGFEGELAEGIVLRGGVVVDTRHHDLLGGDADPWDDSVLMGIYRKSVQSHRRRGKGEPNPNPQEPLVGAPGPWIASIVQEYAAAKAKVSVEQQAPDGGSGSSSLAGRKRQRGGTSRHRSSDIDTDTAFSAADFRPVPSSASPPVAHFSLLDAAFNDMVTAWYHSGYATARYQTLQELLRAAPDGEE